MPAALSLVTDSTSERYLKFLYLFILSTFSDELPGSFPALPDYYFTQIRYGERFVRDVSREIRGRGGGKFRMTNSLYAKFSLWCAERIFEPVR